MSKPSNNSRLFNVTLVYKSGWDLKFSCLWVAASTSYEAYQVAMRKEDVSEEDVKVSSVLSIWDFIQKEKELGMS